MAVSPLRRILGAVLATLLTSLVAVVLGGSLTGPARAAEGFRYWNYWHEQQGAWAFSDVGAGQYRPRDGAVEGYRYGTSTAAVGVEPRADLGTVTFDAICGEETAPAGQKRVAFVIDYGTDADADGATVPAPTTACAVVPAKATGQQALEDVVKVRTQDGGICALDGYPASGCFTSVKNAKVDKNEAKVDFALPTSDDGSGDAAAASSSSEDDGGSALPVVLVVGAVVVLGGGGLLLARRNRAAS